MISTIRKLFAFLTPRERWQIAGIFGLVLTMALLETFAVVSIMPFIALVANPGVLTETPWLLAIYERLGFDSPSRFLVFTGFAVLVLLTVSNAFAAFTHWTILRFTWRKHHRWSTRLFRKYLHNPYTYFLDRNSADLSKNILAEVLVVIQGVFIPVMDVLAKGTVALFIFVLLFAVDVRLALVVAVTLGGAYATIYGIMRGRQARSGRDRVRANTERFQVTGEAFSGIKEVKVLEREEAFVRRFEGPSERFSRHIVSNQILSELPRYAMEAVAFGGIVLIVIYLLAVQQDVGGILPLVSLYAFAGYKLMPALQQIFRGVTTLRFNRASLDDLFADLMGMEAAAGGATAAPTAGASASQPGAAIAAASGDVSVSPTPTAREPAPPSAAAAAPPPAEPAARPETPSIGVSDHLPLREAITFRGVSFRYPSAESPSIRGIDLRIDKDTTVAFVGSTGSGKTTLVDLILGLLEPQEGRIEADGVPISGAFPGDGGSRWRKNVGYVPQEIFLSDDSVAGNIAFGLAGEEIDPEAVERAARVAHIHDFVMGLPAGYETVVGERGVRLSGGQRQRIGIARALYRDPAVLVLDEATSALDGATEELVMQAIHHLSGGKTIIMVAHRITTVQACDVIHLLEEGRVVAAGRYDELMRDEERFRAIAKTAGAG